MDKTTETEAAIAALEKALLAELECPVCSGSGVDWDVPSNQSLVRNDCPVCNGFGLIASTGEALRLAVDIRRRGSKSTTQEVKEK